MRMCSLLVLVNVLMLLGVRWSVVLMVMLLMMYEGCFFIMVGSLILCFVSWVGWVC